MAANESRVEGTLRLDEAANERWEVIVIGAGPAGALAARQSALLGARVLLVDRAAFPREKVCGCCINGAAIGVLIQVGLGDLLRQCQARELCTVHLASQGRFARLRLNQGVSLSRGRFDAALIRAAIEVGAEFLDQTPAQIGATLAESREVHLRNQDSAVTTTATSVIVAGGLGCRVFAEAAAELRQTAEESRVGAGTIVDVAPKYYQTGTIFMACHRHGYVGLVRLEDDRLDIATALDATAIKQHDGIPALVQHILTEAGLPIAAPLDQLNWHGTGRLTQRRQHVAADRCFFIGDAAGYVEPFTGEGMAWALASGRSVAPIVVELCRHNLAPEAARAWKEAHRRLIVRRARRCRYLSRFLRHPSLVSIAIRLLAFAPALANPVVRSLNDSFETDSPHNAARKSLP